MPNRVVELVLAAGAELAEGPFWLNEELIWVNANQGELHQTNVHLGTDIVSQFDTEFGVVIPTREPDQCLASTMDGFAVIDAGQLEVVDPIASSSELFMNDGKCDARGRLWTSTNRRDLAPEGGSLHVWEPNAPSRCVEKGFTLLNGIGWSPDDSVMYVVDSIQQTLFAYDFDLDDAALSNKRVLRQFSESDGLPDGLAVDAEGCIWIAFYSGGQICRITTGGSLVERIEMPVSRPTSCAFGNGTDLYVTSAWEGLTDAERQVEPLAGSIWRIDVGVAGAPCNYAEARS